VSISSVNSSNWASLLTSSMKSNASSSTTTETSTSSLEGVVSSNSDGDTFQISKSMYKDRDKLAAYLYSKLDTNDDESLTEEEFLAACPSVITEEMSESIYKSMDADGDGSVSEAEFGTAYVTALESEHPPFNDQSKKEEITIETSITTAKLTYLQNFINMDTDGDGLVSEDEFSIVRPGDVTAEMSKNLFSSFDTDSSGSLTESEYETAMNNAPSVETAVTSVE
jgi:Ca2+-binding EF-hand superfamily protein